MKEFIYIQIARLLKYWFLKSETRSKKIAKTVEILEDEILQEIIVDAARYLAAKSTNSYDDKIVAELTKQTVLPKTTKRTRSNTL